MRQWVVKTNWHCKNQYQRLNKVFELNKKEELITEEEPIIRKEAIIKRVLRNIKNQIYNTRENLILENIEIFMNIYIVRLLYQNTIVWSDFTMKYFNLKIWSPEKKREKIEENVYNTVTRSCNEYINAYFDEYNRN